MWPAPDFETRFGGVSSCGFETTTELMRTIIGVVLIIAGIALFIQGLTRRDSLVGRAAEASTQIANRIDGRARTPKHVGYMIGGGVLVLVGIGVMARPATRPR